MDVGDESDTTEDDLVMVDGGGFANDNAKFAISPESISDATAKSNARIEIPFQPPHLTKRETQEKLSQAPEVSRVTASAQTPVVAPAPHRPPLVQVGPSHLPGFFTSRASSSDGLSSVFTSATVRSPACAPIDELKQQTSGHTPASALPNNYLSQMRRKILDREFWMRDENAKDCFNCGDSFSTFRRKHHCRTCGQIFDSKCTSLVSGKVFGQSGNLRVCKPCEAIIYGHDDDSSIYTDEGDQTSIYEQESLEAGDFDPSESDHTKIGTPTISIPMTRKVGSEKKRRSAVIEVAPPALARPSSSRSLRSLSGRPRSSSHKRHNSRHQHMRTVKYDDRAPFHQHNTESRRSRSALPAFHHDNIIDPDLAPFMSDEDSTEDEQASIFATLRGDSPSHINLDSERGGLGGLLSAMRKGKPRPHDRSIAGVVGYGRDADNASITSRHVNRHSRRRNLSVSSLTHGRPSPRRTKSNSLLRSFGATLGVPGPAEHASAYPSPQLSHAMPRATLGITRSASMRGTNTPAMELNQASMHHVRMLLKQMLHDASIPNASNWEKALLPILLQCTDDVNPDVQRSDDMDIRHYIKLKKIPGGRPKDTSYVSGVVFTKQLERKGMPRSVPHPRIIIVTFAIEYARHQAHFIQLDRVVAQEREYLRNLVGRIAHLEPHILLVQRNVSGLALEFLQEAGIVVASNVKETVLNAVSRCTGAPMISSVDKLAIDRSYLGQCDSFDVKTYVHKNIRKTYIFLSGCQPELGCTIVLRGAETGVLRKLKRITEFMCYVVYNLKLETCLMRDEFVLIPSSSLGGTLASNSKEDQNARHRESTEQVQPDAEAQEDSSPPPSADDTPQSHQKDSHPKSDDIPTLEEGPAPSFYSEMVEKHRTTILSASPFVKFAQPYLLNQAREYERKLVYLKRLLDQYTSDEVVEKGETPQSFELVQPEMVHNMVDRASRQVREFLHAVHASEYDKAWHNYQTQKKHWEAFLSGNMDLYNPFNHQKIAALYSVVNSSTSTPCVGPEIIALGFYQEHDYDDGFTPDCTLGQYVEDLIHSARMVCEVDNCNKRLLEHHRQYVHGHGQISVHVVVYPPKLRNMHNTILMWSLCRKCSHETQVMPMSHNTWKYSFAKYLELTFWSSDLHPRSNACGHDIHRDHVRFFGLNNLALRIQYDQVPLYEVIVPRQVITWKVDSDLKLKNDLFINIEERLNQFTASVRARLNSIRSDSVMPENVDLCKAEVDKLMQRCNEEHDWLKKKLQEKYMTSKYYEIIPLNRAIRAMQEKAIAWDDTFTEFEERFFPSEKDIKRLAALQLKRIFLERDESTSSLTSVEEGAEPGDEESPLTEKGDPMPMTPMPSTMSPERTRDMLTEVVEEDQSHPNKGHYQEATASKEPRLLATPSPTQALPEKTPIEALEREDVRHLDLAVSSNFTDTAQKEESMLKTRPSVPDFDISPEVGSPTPKALPKVEPVDKAVADAVDNMPVSPPTPSPLTAGALESRIPRLVDTMRRDTVVRPSVAARTQSQPGGIPKLHTSQSTSPSAVPGSVASSSGDSLKQSLSESARALERRMSERLNLGAFRQARSSSMIPIPRSTPGKGPRELTRVSALAKHFEQLQREFEKERRRERLQQQRQNRHARAYPLASSKPVVEVYNDVHEAVQEHSPSDEDANPSPERFSTDNSTLTDSAYTATTGATTAETSPLDERHPKPAEPHPRDNEEKAASISHPTSDVENETSDVEIGPEDIPLPDSVTGSQLLEGSLELPKHEKNTLMKMLTSFWSERSASGWATLEYPLGHNEHVWEDSDIIVREDEPSSIIALALSSPDYLVKRQSFREDPTIAPNGVGGLEGSQASIERNLLHEANTNIRYSFTNRGVKAHCKIFYAESFDALRRKCGVADRFVESLSRCSKWDSKGGKSKSIFLKTLDERFVLKSLSAIEVNAFFRFAPNYFAFTHQNLFKGLPSVIAKMFGLFQVQIKTPTGRDFDGFMLVMENLFYEREPNRRYDLKGSMRNRKAQPTGDRDEVLLDENLVDIIYSETPIFVREHTKKLLKASVWNDTLFLQQQNVMDYSLMAGFHDESREIIVGIIGKSTPILPRSEPTFLTLVFHCRLHTHIYVGQEARVVDQRPWQE
jgi:1-phosphatidylinositol-3-phosphate 5-kinase